ncbi:MAG: sigma-54-dependent transcriptional regulator [Myxococcota bacterium]
MKVRVLVVDDKENVVNMLKSVLSASCDVTTATDGQRALALALNGDFDVVLSDIRMPGADGFTLLNELKRGRPEVEIVLMTAFGTVEKAVEAIKSGAYDYLTKPFEPDDALLTVERAAERRRLRRETQELRAALDAAQSFERLAGRTPQMHKVFELLRRAASKDVSVLITGERGTGKQLAARAIHRASMRRDVPFIVVNCAAVPEQVLEAEPFLDTEPPSKPSEANSDAGQQATLLLDEVDELPPPLQAKLTRGLQERAARSADRTASFRVRLIATTSVDLKDAIGAGRFREDLFYQLNVLRIHLPPLRERKEDIPLLAAGFVESHGRRFDSQVEGFTPEALSALMRYAWPGNVRELENAIERALAVIDGPRILVEALPDEVRGKNPEHGFSGLAQLTYRDAVELARERASREYLITLMREFSGSVTAAAERAGIERESLHRLLKRYGLRSNEFKSGDG